MGPAMALWKQEFLFIRARRMSTKLSWNGTARLLVIELFRGVQRIGLIARVFRLRKYFDGVARRGK